ncbi:MAG: hypothetical protein R2704_10075 [Microthrixaceae bacterium]
MSLFADGALVGDPETVDCTLSGGEESSCYELTIAGYPADYDVGPFCPSTIEDSAEEGGVWFDGEDIYDLDGQFIVDLPELYGDDNWQLYDDEGNVFVTDTEEAFDGAARPDVEEQYRTTASRVASNGWTTASRWNRPCRSPSSLWPPTGSPSRGATPASRFRAW